MGRWQGNIKNPAPNAVKETIERSEKFITDNDPTAFVSNNRAEQVRRDKDNQKDFTITFYDIDETILTHLQRLQIQITDIGKRVNVPIFFGPPERWVSAQRDGYIRDKQGKIMQPAMIIKRSNSENDQSLMFFNRYLDTPSIKLYSEKNKYTKFSALTGQNAPVNEIFNVLVPKHMILTYHCIVWTALVEQMNEVIQTILYNTQDYWGSKKGFRFRVNIEGNYTHNIEIQSGDERSVKTEFDLRTHGYILPDTVTHLERHKMTTQKRMTKKKFIMGIEVVKSDFELSQQLNYQEKWRSPKYPNLRYDTVIPEPGITVDTTIKDNSFLEAGPHVGIKVDNSPLFLRIVPVPTSQNAGGQDGDISYDDKYLYVHIDHQWKWVAISEFTNSCEDGMPLFGTPGSIEFNNNFFYIYSKGMWRKVALSEFGSGANGHPGDVMFDTNYFYLFTGGQWKRVALASLKSNTTSCLEKPSPEGYPPEGFSKLVLSTTQ
ncbi:MAG TPA: hypothetical protein PLC59_00575 [Bacteroidales bacterium]|jgi:hypothetical protein|nr:hypothetical protein [Bacteroidales bacterium]HQI44559.1 hypothetical protein [Bacteroidales bacterium]